MGTLNISFVESTTEKSTKIMGNKEGKFKKAFEEIDTSGDKKVSIQELVNYFDPNKSNIKELFEESTEEELAQFSQELMKIGGNDVNNDGKLSFEEFMEALKENET